MAPCGCGSQCECLVTAGPGVTVSGDGGTASPYVISATGGSGSVTVADSPSVDMSGDGSAGAPITAAVIPDPVAGNLLTVGPAGVAVTCEAVQDCVGGAFGDGLAYDDDANQMTARLSSDAGNNAAFGGDGGIYVPAAAGSTVVVDDSPSVDMSGDGSAGAPITAAVRLDAAPPAGGDNLISEGPDGLYVECGDVRSCLSEGDGIDYDPATGTISARPSTDAGNTLSIGGDGGLMVPPGAGGATAIQVTDTPSVDLTLTGTGAAADPYDVTAAVKLEPAPPGGGTNLIGEGPDGLYVECADVRGCISAGDGAAYDPATGEISARVSTDAGNNATFGGDGGIYVPAAAGSTVALQDSPTVDLEGDGSAGAPITAEVIPDPVAGNLLTTGPAGVAVTCEAVQDCVGAALGDGLVYDDDGNQISAQLSGDAGNQVTIGSDGGLMVPASADGATAIEVSDTPSVDLTLTGTGAAGDPYDVSAAVRLDAAPPGGGTNLIQEGPDGLFVECEQVRSCMSAGPGVDYDPATGVIGAAISTDPGNQVTLGGDDGLYVAASAAAIATDCGLAGDGSAGAPLAAAVQPWPYPCDVTAEAGGVYCDDNGVLRAEPRAKYEYFSTSENELFPDNPAVPTSTSNTPVTTRSLTVTNPDTCRDAIAIVEVEVDVDFVIPPGGRAGQFTYGEEMYRFENEGNNTVFDVHTQTTKVVGNTVIPAGATQNVDLEIGMGFGQAGATYNRIQSLIRAMVFAL